jgi:hypothetical protein
MFTGPELLAKVKELGDVSKSELVRECPRFQESCHPSDQYIRGLEDMTNASLQRGR